MPLPGRAHRAAGRPLRRLLVLAVAALAPALSVVPAASAEDTRVPRPLTSTVDGSGTGGPSAQAALLSTEPAAGAGSVGLTPTVTATFDRTVADPDVRFTLTGPAGAVEGTATPASGLTARFTPAAPLDPGTTYTASVHADGTAATWQFTTGSPRAADCPCSIWDDFAVPGRPSTDDRDAVELGAKVYFTGRGEVLGVRFYKGLGNTGTHTGSFWSATGQRLATGTFTDETTTGWQTLVFATPVVVEPNRPYVVSYFAPHGHYAIDGTFFGNYGRTVGHDQVWAVPDTTATPNGLFRYGGGMPDSGFHASNYWVDVLYRHGADGDYSRPVLDARTPAPDATDVPLDGVLTLDFDEAIDPASPRIVLTDEGGAELHGTAAVSADGRTVTWTPDGPLTPGARHTASALVADVRGNALARAETWSFTTAPTADCPCSLFSTATVPAFPASADQGPLELGVRFGSAAAGAVTGVRFYKGEANTGTHTGSLWSADGALLATGTFTDETVTGWQELTFATPVPIEANRVYVASYTTPSGHHAVDHGYFDRRPRVLSAPLWTAAGPYANGRFRQGAGFPTNYYGGNNYWVDVVFTTS
ncbi:DUF4082 domain-containing protein [Saccharothrix longispora]|uniref:Ig-like domain-containing protein n=1 Tax=Saccharothrix longispora TaxID=33920 RepID=A0ABU1PVP0_9PSEU|nr:DUF4082 domain-containing protein [Saccharothrix longispora]MDR6594707.1 hypothetical protein [Saccharothrix longispora]